MATKKKVVYEATPESINPSLLYKEEGLPSPSFDDLAFFYPHASLELFNQLSSKVQRLKKMWALGEFDSKMPLIRGNFDHVHLSRRKRVHFIVASCGNMISGGGMRPGDILTASNGKTMEAFFLGDGAGVGEGRTIAGLIWKNWHHGRIKALWISIGSNLKFFARKDLDDVAATCIQVHALNKLLYSKLDSKSVGITRVLFSRHIAALFACSEKGRSRLQQLVQWFGSDYDGLIVFDECHKAKNLVPKAGGQPTRTGEAVLDIQERNNCKKTQRS